MLLTSIYRLPQVKAVTGLSRSTIYAEIAKGKFPAPVSLTDDGRAVGWSSVDIDAWLTACVNRAEKKASAKCAEVTKGASPAPVSLTDDGRAVGCSSVNTDARLNARISHPEKKAGAK
jgi:prophage regulatory protein